MVTSMHIDPNKMVTINIDGIPVTVPSGTTIMEAARKVGIKIPSLCHHPDLGVRAFCRVCLVEDSHSRRLKTACNNLVDEAGDITTNSPKVRKARQKGSASIARISSSCCLQTIHRIVCIVKETENVNFRLWQQNIISAAISLIQFGNRFQKN